MLAWEGESVLDSSISPRAAVLWLKTQVLAFGAGR